MDGHDRLAERFEQHGTRLRAVAYRMPGSVSALNRIRLLRMAASNGRNVDRPARNPSTS
jgi:hypothetical protein